MMAKRTKTKADLYEELENANEEIESLWKRLEACPDKLPNIESAMDQLKFEFFVDNFSKIPLDALEWVVKTVNENKIPV